MSSLLHTVILADDDEDDVEFFREALKNTYPGVHLVVAADGKKLLNLLETVSAPMAIILDVNMPLLSGKECLALLRKKNHFDGVPVFMLSTSSQRREIDSCIQLGAEKYFVKPSSFAGMEKIIREMCAGRVDNNFLKGYRTSVYDDHRHLL